MLLEKVLIDLKYGERDKYISVIEKICKLVSEDGKLGLFVSNVPYWLELTLAVSTSTNYKAIIQLAQEHYLLMDYTRGIPELMDDLLNQKSYDFIEIESNETYEEIQNKVNAMCYFPTIAELNKKGYACDIPMS